MLNRLNFVHGLNFYGSYLAIKNKYIVDIGEDLEMLTNNEFFYKNVNILYKFLNSDLENLLNEDSRKNKKSLNFGNDIDNDILEIENINSIINLKDTLDISFNSTIIYEQDITKNKSSSNSSCSSRSSNTENDSNSISEEEDESSTSSIEDNILVSIDQFPINIIGLEKCEDTLDSLFEQGNFSQDELSCIVVQMLMILITYQKIFNLTHNDLHTNNIMFIKTEKVYLYYKINNKHYKIKTYGKIFKIIDYGRAIYRYKNKLICSDSFQTNGDAATQYNFEPYYNSAKPIIEPNFSFDLCRLGCSIYDFIVDEYESFDDISWPIHKIIMDWCLDDNGVNILYKTNDVERYPDFKLYKMIARKVHNHMPINELNNKYFERYIVSRKEIKKGSNIWNIDKLNEYKEFQDNIERMDKDAQVSKSIKPKKILTNDQIKMNNIRAQIKESKLKAENVD